MLRELLPDDREVRGLLALMLLTDARRATAPDADGQLLLLEEQDRSRWDRAAIDEGLGLVRVRCGRPGRGPGCQPGRFALQAAIAAVHAEAPSYGETDWPQLLQLYDELLKAWPTPVVALNRAVVTPWSPGRRQAWGHRGGA